MTRLLVADFDVKRAIGRGCVDAAGQVAADAAAFAELVRSCGGRGFGDISPNGGRHAYVLLAVPVPHSEMRAIAMALARRFTSLDPSPMLGWQDGIIRPPGSRHRSGGWQLLTTPIEHARHCAAHPNPGTVLDRLCEALSGDLAAIENGAAPLPSLEPERAPQAAESRLDGAGTPWLPRPGGPLPKLREDLELIAVTGEFDRARLTTIGAPWSPSEARFAVLCSAAARGWRLSDVTDRVRSGAWARFGDFYGRYRRPAQRARALEADWKKAVAVVSGGKSSHDCDTRGSHHRGGNPAGGNDLGRQQEIRRIDAALRSVENHRWTGPGAITLRLVMRALLAAAEKTGSLTVEFGCRSLAIQACCDHTTVARALRQLREEPPADRFIELVRPGRGVRADLYELRLPDSCQEAATWRRWRPGKLGAHPVFYALGGAAALVCEHLLDEPTRTIDLPDMTGLSPTTVTAALADLAAHGIAERGPGGWRRGPVSLDTAAAHLRVPETLAELQQTYKQERAEWRVFLRIVERIPAPPVAVAAEPDWPLIEDPAHIALADVRGPPTPEEMAADAIAELQAVFGPVRVISVS